MSSTSEKYMKLIAAILAVAVVVSSFVTQNGQSPYGEASHSPSGTVSVLLAPGSRFTGVTIEAHLQGERVVLGRKLNLKGRLNVLVRKPLLLPLVEKANPEAAPQDDAKLSEATPEELWDFIDNALWAGKKAPDHNPITEREAVSGAIGKLPPEFVWISELYKKGDWVVRFKELDKIFVGSEKNRKRAAEIRQEHLRRAKEAFFSLLPEPIYDALTQVHNSISAAMFQSSGWRREDIAFITLIARLGYAHRLLEEAERRDQIISEYYVKRMPLKEIAESNGVKEAEAVSILRGAGWSLCQTLPPDVLMDTVLDGVNYLYIVKYRDHAVVCMQDKVVEIVNRFNAQIEMRMQEAEKRDGRITREMRRSLDCIERLFFANIEPVTLVEGKAVPLSDQFFKFFKGERSFFLVENPDERVIELWPQRNLGTVPFGDSPLRGGYRSPKQSKDTRSSVLAPGSRFGEGAAQVIISSGKTLCISPKALKQMETLDKLMSGVSKEKRDMELGGVGLTRKVDDNTTLVVDFIVPDPEKVYCASDPFFPDSKFGTALAGSRELYLTLQGNKVVATFDNGKVIGIDRQWIFIKRDVKRLSGRKLPSDLNKLKAMLQKEGRIAINTGWELIASNRILNYTVSFKERVDRETKRQNALPGFDRHYHPRTALVVIPSDGDMTYWKDQGIEWAEIRMPCLSEGGFISRFYHSSEIEGWAVSVDAIIRKFQELPDEETNDYEALNNILEEMFDLAKKLSTDVELTQVVLFLFASRISVSESYLKDLFMVSLMDVCSLRDFILYEIAHLRRSMKNLRWGLRRALRVHIQLETPQLISRRLAIEARYPKSRYPMLWSKVKANEFYVHTLLLQDEPKQIQRSAEGCRRVLDALEKAIVAGEVGDEFFPSSANFDEAAETRISP